MIKITMLISFIGGIVFSLRYKVLRVGHHCVFACLTNSINQKCINFL